MQFGFNLPNSGALATPRSCARIAREGEALGYDYLTVTDHVVLPDMAEPGYPYSESGAFYSTDSAHRHEMLTLAAWLAAMTTRLRLVLAVLVVPHRPAVLAAKMLSTIDVLSGGRLTVGIGAGWLKAEFDAVVTTPFAERGAVTDEYVAAFKTLWTEKKPADRRQIRALRPAAARAEAGAEAAPADLGRRRERPVAAPRRRLGDAWYPIGTNNAHPYDSLPRYRAGVARLRQLTEAAGRSPDAVALTYRVKRYGAICPTMPVDGERRLFSGSDADIIGDIHALEDLGVTAIDFDFERPRKDWLAATQEKAIEPDRPIIDPHHHLWDRPGNRYLLHDLSRT
jgi:alkanesulfonate monooxygenase SsuD/methylene tetrahydromethanopterin reductase-like flavin-dependent oxidoreductase (luciferase family)